jgi:hypothetical protein
VRTVYRDIDALVATGVPIEGERGVGCTLHKALRLPPLTFTAAELEGLALGARRGTEIHRLVGRSRNQYARGVAGDRRSRRLCPTKTLEPKTGESQCFMGGCTPCWLVFLGRDRCHDQGAVTGRGASGGTRRPGLHAGPLDP